LWRGPETPAMKYWLFKSEPDVYGFDRLKRERITPWSGVRNFQARNLMREMQAGDLGFFYHSSTAVPGIAGICRVVREAYADASQFERDGEYEDKRATPARPIWENVDVAYEGELARFVPLAELRANPWLAGMALLRKGQRLSVQPVSREEWAIILRMAESPEAGT
jgi:predicted RNA-binding protein with PUA-like domain